VAHSREESGRARIARVLAAEIISQNSEDMYAIASEHDISRRFKISRVTVRLALGDLEARGLIFRRHGKGTFAFGRAKRVQRSLGVLWKRPLTQRQWPITDLICGFQRGAAAFQGDVLLLHASPQEWATEIIKDLGGIFIIPTGMVCGDVIFLQQLKLPLLWAWEVNLPGGRIDFCQAVSTRVIAEKLLTSGHERIVFLGGLEGTLDELRRDGINRALKSIRKSSKDLVEYVVPQEEKAASEIFADLIAYKPRLTAVITADDSIAASFVHFLSSRANIPVPEVVSTGSFHRFPFPPWMKKAFPTISFDFFNAGRIAANCLARASMTGETLTDIVLPGILVGGATK
jgi:DNA-binding LacI/PurR family transcriptional regulator